MQNGVGINNRFVKNVGKIAGNVILLLDCENLLTAEEIEALGKAI
jgi:purine-binding chemotaxis protein CheW